MTESARKRAAGEFAVFSGCFFAAWTMRATFGYATDESITSPGARVVYSNAVKFLLWVVPPDGTVVHRRPGGAAGADGGLPSYLGCADRRA